MAKAIKKAAHGAKMKKAMYGAKMKKAEMGAKLKEVPSEAKGLSKLPKSVRNKMGYMKNGGKVTDPKKKYKRGKLDMVNNVAVNPIPKKKLSLVEKAKKAQERSRDIKNLKSFGKGKGRGTGVIFTNPDVYKKIKSYKRKKK